MTKGNYSSTTTFILTGFKDHPELKVLLFVVFLAIYLVTMVGNLGLVALIYVERRLHTPMYIFLGNLALMDSCCSSAITPKVLENLFSEDRMISFYECVAQFYFFSFAETADCFLLAAMAYDRYVAICSPLQYHSRMSKKLCIQITTGIYVIGHLHPLFTLSCVDPYINDLMMLILSGSIQAFTITVVLVSYFYILFTIFTMKSKGGQSKALSTCASHFLSVSMFYGSLLFVYVQPHSVNEGDKDKASAVFYTLIIPLLNPFIYSLRNKEVINVIKRIMNSRNIWTL